MKNIVINIKKYICYIIDVIFVTLLILGIIFIFQTTVLNKKYVNIFDYTIFRVITGSMREEIDINDIVVVKITKDIAQNDIIVFEQNGDLIVHRIIEKNDDYLITKGDANNYSDDPIKEEQVIGKVVKKISSSFLLKIVITIISLKLMINLVLKIINACQNKAKTKERNDSTNETK